MDHHRHVRGGIVARNARADVSFATVNSLYMNETGQVSLETLDKLALALSEVLKRSIEPGELIEREGERRGKGR
jgi:DNA-binding Xre family transcriptional regulator